MMEEQAARCRIRLLGAFTPAPSGRRFPISAASFLTTMAEAALTVEASVPDRLGAGGERKLTLSFAKPASFALAQVIASVAELGPLRALAERLRGGTVSVEDALAEARTLVGEGALTRALAATLAPPPVPASTPASGVEAIFATGEVKPPAPGAAGAIDSFVRNMRGTPPARRPTSASSAKSASGAVEDAVYATAAAALAHPRVARLEGSWRGLKLLVDQCPAAAQIALELIDTNDAAGALARDLPDDPSDRPDLFVVVDEVGDVATLRRIAEAAEEALAPAIVAVAPSLFGAGDAAGVALAAAQPGGCLPEDLVALRAEECSRWLACVLNRGVVAAEGAGANRRVALTSPALVLAAQLAASFRDTRAFARILGGAGALDLPATRELSEGRDAGTTVPTEAFYSLSAQTTLAGLGLIGLGSARNSSKVALSAAPTARHSTDAVPLPAQLLAGKLVRFVSWIRRELPPDASDADAASMFEQAAQVFLFAGMGEGATLRAGVGRDESGKRVVEIAASWRAEHAAIPFQMAFTLPL